MRDSSRAAAARRLLASADAPDCPGENWADSKTALDDALAAFDQVDGLSRLTPEAVAEALD